MTGPDTANRSLPGQPASDGQEGPAFAPSGTAVPASEALRSYLLTVRQITGADTASLLLCSAAEHHASTAQHTGTLPPVPELEDEKTVWNLAAGTGLHADDGTVAADRPLFHFMQSSTEGGYLIGMSMSRFQALMVRKQEPASGFERRKPATSPPDSSGDWMVWMFPRAWG